jgi:hypothetical protein
MLARFPTGLLTFCLLVRSGLSTSAGAAEPPRVTDLVPQKAIASIFFRNINELRANGDQLFVKAGWPFAPTQMLSWAGQELKVNGLVDGDRPCGVAFFEFENEKRPGGFFLPPAAAMFAIRDLDALAQRLGTTSDDLKAGKTISSPGQLGYKNRHYRFSGDYLWIASDERLFVELSNRMPLNFAIAKPRRERMQKSDILLSFRPTAQAADRERMLKNGQKWIDEHPEMSVEEQAAMRELFAVFESMSNAVLGVHVHKDGVEVDADVYFDFRKREAVQTVLQRFNPTGAASSLAGLPDGKVLFSHALQADGKATLPALNALLPELTLTRNWRSVDGLEVLTEVQQLKLLGLFGEVWRKLKGYRLATYLTGEPSQHGLLGIAAVLDADDPEHVVSDVRELSEFIDGSRLFVPPDTEETDNSQPPPRLSDEGEARVRKLVEQLSSDDSSARQSATIRLMLIGEPVRPFLEPLTERSGDNESSRSESSRQARRVITLLDKARERNSKSALTPRFLDSADLRFRYSTSNTPDSNRQVHSIKVEHVARTGKLQILQQQTRKLFGPEWNRLQLVPFENRLLILIGSDPDLLRRAIASVESQNLSLQNETSAAIYGSPLNAARGAEFHIDLALIHDVFSRPRQVPEAPDRKAPQKQAQPSADSDNQPAPDSTSTSDSDLPASGKPDRPQTDFSSLTFTIQDDYLSIEWRLPVSEIQALNSGI